MHTYARQPVAFERGEGCWLWDENGTRYLDALAGIAVCNIGHANPHVAAAISEQANRLVHTSNLYGVPLQAELAAALCRLSGLDKVFFGNSGAEANEAAIKICRKFANDTGKQNARIIVMDRSFHGRTLATLSATGNSKVKNGFHPLVEGFVHIPYDDIDSLQEIAGNDDSVVAVMLEPVQGEGGVVVPAEGYLAAIREICDQKNWLMVLDEVQTGMCRTGEWFAWQHTDTRPDIMTLAKSLANGFPIGACLVKDSIAEIMVPGTHASTFGGSPLASRAALAVIEQMENHEIAARVAELGPGMLQLFREKLHDLDGVVDVRGLGLMIGIELREDCADLVTRALEKKILINVTAGKVVRLLPPLTISDEEMLEIVDLVSQLIREHLEG